MTKTTEPPTITPVRNPYAGRTTYRVTVPGVGTRDDYRTIEAAEDAGRRMASGELEPQYSTGDMRIVALVPVGRAAR